MGSFYLLLLHVKCRDTEHEDENGLSVDLKSTHMMSPFHPMNDDI